MSIQQTVVSFFEEHKNTGIGIILGMGMLAVGGQFFPGYTLDSNVRILTAAAAEDSATAVHAGYCVEEFRDSTNAEAQYAVLQEKSRWQRDQFIEDGKWAPDNDSAAACAKILIDEGLTAGVVAATG